MSNLLYFLKDLVGNIFYMYNLIILEHWRNICESMQRIFTHIDTPNEYSSSMLLEKGLCDSFSSTVKLVNVFLEWLKNIKWNTFLWKNQSLSGLFLLMLQMIHLHKIGDAKLQTITKRLYLESVFSKTLLHK